jgi:hypothetical protein
MSVTDQPQWELSAGVLVGKVIWEAKEIVGSAAGSELAPGPKSRPDDLPRWLEAPVA